MKKVLVTGASGQLGYALQQIQGEYPNLVFDFMDSQALDITDDDAVNYTFKKGGYHFCVNCAAYTNVERAEKEPEKAYAVNAQGVENLAVACKEYDVTLIHISTDYVFDGEKEEGYIPSDTPNPINVYGESKLKGEQIIQELLRNYSIIRTSWLYHKNYGHNFYRTVVAKIKAGVTMQITDTQKGCPTNVVNLAHIICRGLEKEKFSGGLRHFTDGEVLTWYDFATKIIAEQGLKEGANLVSLGNYRTFARRPKNSVLLP